MVNPSASDVGRIEQVARNEKGVAIVLASGLDEAFEGVQKALLVLRAGMLAQIAKRPSQMHIRRVQQPNRHPCTLCPNAACMIP
jgi:hypothetical protein